METYYIKGHSDTRKLHEHKLVKKQKGRVSIIILVITSLVLLFEVFSGALRYYFTQWNLSFMIYLPKVICLFAVIIKVVALKIKNLMLFAFLMLSILISLFHSATMFNIFFSIFVYCPFLFGFLYGQYLEIKRKELLIIVWICFLSSILGVYLDYVTELPWKGFVYNIGGVEIEANRQWSTLGEDRIAGFSRLSASLAFMIAIFSTYINMFLKSKFLKLFLLIVTFCSLILTTNKTAVISYFSTSIIYFYYYERKFIKGFFFFITFFGCFLPIIGIFLDYSVDSEGFGVISRSLLFSFDDRLTNTWPFFYQCVRDNNGFIWGTGIGTIGSAFSSFPIRDITTIKGYGLGVADNTFLYLWGLFGLFGIFLYTRFYWLMNRLVKREDSFSVALCGIVVCICIISWTTDSLEAVISSLFLGIASSVALRGRKNA
ncbi:MAG: hypothetical protein REI96_07305 [Flavobacterium nitrogenifigens]|uniref:O-Antigen ligase n=1 Tax=Flavobacterium nitrogenifigens TaxID=1617283 RepID=A0A521DKS6_9FLAO|nr:hypothetical protein [Flavobacterium nitrogenifigens]KAF2330059.1 hypothetical protein DM397_15120 [Flavobacterium nitrogenifigens]MDQ8012237.1 hypothetical protein [Flavobacterium nitrogenifigens]SMO71701.1 hypothetical protein SAMN06265220_10394 [Flavobacterium nitrogenifigens]